MEKGIIRILVVLGIVFINVGCDQVTKQAAREQLQNQAVHTFLGDMFILRYVENTGAFLSLGSDLSEGSRYWILQIFPVVMLLGLFFYVLLSSSLNRWQIIAFSFIIGGGISNIYDRLLYNFVVDFMNMGIGDVRTGIFNFADVSIMIGLFMMLPFIFRKEKAKAPQEKVPEEAS